MPSYYGPGADQFAGRAGMRTDSAVPASTAARRDSQTLYLEQELEYMTGRVIEDVRPELLWEQHLSVTTEAGGGASAVTWNEISTFGEMSRVSGAGSAEAGRVGARKKKRSMDVEGYEVAFGWNRQEMLAARRTNTPLRDIYLRAALRAYRETVEKVMLFGDPETTQIGLFNNSRIPRYKLDITFDDDTDAQKIVDGLVNFIDAKAELTNSAEASPSEGGDPGQVLVLPDTSFRYIRKRELDTTNRIKIKEEVESITGVTIASSRRLRNVPTKLSGMDKAYDMLALIDPRPEKGEGHIPMPFDVDPEIQRAGNEYLVYCYAEIAGFAAYVPEGFMTGYVKRAA